MSLKSLVAKQKLVKNDISRWFIKLGYQLPLSTRKGDLLDTLDLNLKNEASELSINLISLDMGLKNMSLSKFSKSKNDKIPTLHQWIKLNLEPFENYQFNPVNYSKITNQFLNDFIISKDDNNDSPQTVLFERQRFRTGGSSNVLESTLKTNTIEAMLCMGLTLHNDFKSINIVPSPPGAMVKYWQNKYLLNDTKVTEKESKNFRIQLILSLLFNTLSKSNLHPKNIKYDDFMLTKGDIVKFQLSPMLINNLKTAFADDTWLKSWNGAWNFKSSSRRLWEVCKLLNGLNEQGLKITDHETWGVKKGDDLADSLLHGLAYFDYLANREMFKNMIKNGDNLKLF